VIKHYSEPLQHALDSVVTTSAASLRFDACAVQRPFTYVRQLRDWKMSAVIEEMTPPSMQVYARLCGWTLARAHARSGDRIAISAYLGTSNTFDIAVTDFAETYAGQNERDHAALAAAVADGRVEAQSGV
jgi:Uncharacterized protein conserved in bacteria (DUF2252)